MSDVAKYHLEKLIDCINASHEHIEQLKNLDVPVLNCMVLNNGEKTIQMFSAFDIESNFNEHDTYQLNRKARKLSVYVDDVEIFVLRGLEETV